MSLAYHFHQDSPTPGLDDLIVQQKAHGGRLIQYRRAWAAIAVLATQDRIEWVPAYRSRVWAGWRHSLFTCVLGVWSLMSIFAVPMILFSNFRGGIDVTEFYSDSAIDPLRSTSPDGGTAEREVKQAQWAMVVFLSLVLAIALSVVFR